MAANGAASDSKRPVVCDNGSGMVKAGFAGDEAPQLVFPNIIGRSYEADTSVAEMYLGYQAQAKSGVLKIENPIAHGIVTNWDYMELIWRHIFHNELYVDINDHAVLLTEAPLNPKVNREKMTEIMFEAFGVPAMYIASQAVLSLHACGRTTGVVLESGDGVSHIVPIYEGNSLPQAIGRLDIAGRDITGWLARLLTERGTTLAGGAELEIVRGIKERLCYVALEYDKEMNTANASSALQKEYVLPDGKSITVGAECFRAPEILFNPKLLGREEKGIKDLLVKCLNVCDVDLRKYLFSTIVLAGGSTMFEGFAGRLHNEIVAKMPTASEVRVIAPPERRYSAWIGGSILASLSSFSSWAIARADYEEEGASIVHRKCIS